MTQNAEIATVGESEQDAWDALWETDAARCCSCPACNYYAPDYEEHKDEPCLLLTLIERIIAARLGDGATTVEEWGVKWISKGPHPTRVTGQWSTFATREEAERLASYAHVHQPKISSRIITTTPWCEQSTPPAGNQDSSPSGRGNTEGGRDAQQHRHHPDPTRHAPQGVGRPGLLGGPGVPDRAGPDPQGGRVRPDRGLTEGGVRDSGSDPVYSPAGGDA